MFFCVKQDGAVILTWCCVCHRGGRMGWTSTHGRMQTTTSTRLPTALAFCSKSNLPLVGLSSHLSVTLKTPSHWRHFYMSPLSHQWARAANSQCSWRKGGATFTLLIWHCGLRCLTFNANSFWRPSTAKASGDWANGEMVEDGEEMGQVQEQWEGEYITVTSVCPSSGSHHPRRKAHAQSVCYALYSFSSSTIFQMTKIYF